MGLPDSILKTRLYSCIQADAELLNEISGLRSVVSALAETTGRTVPDFTDHTVRHMDALWGTADEVLTTAETAALTPAEAFILASGFYLHDIGMAYAATDEGLARIKSSNPFRGVMAQLSGDATSQTGAEAYAVATAVRVLHANAAKELATSEIPGSGKFLFEKPSFREKWGKICGDIAMSHHWNLAQLESAFGAQSDAPLPDNRRGDLLYVAACLRLIDYAHINRDRASPLDRAFRAPLNRESLVHWRAQEHIDGPIRSENTLIYRASTSISDVDAWWLFYEMLVGLDSEIRAVRRLLDQRKERLKRISLIGVQGAGTPEDASQFIPTSGFLPIEVNLRTGSIERLVELLAGETLYGPNPMAAVRELIQNARDAVLLKRQVASDESERATLSLPIRVSLNTKSSPPTLEFIDYGIGMSRKVITDYLVSIASNYWATQFAMDFPSAAEKGFKNAGKFGIGFLSIFMLGDEVSVESNRAGLQRYRLTLRGVGRRGELRPETPPSGSGTKIVVKLRSSAVDGIMPLDELVRVYAPTLPHDLTVEVDGTRSELQVGWLGKMDAATFHSWAVKAASIINRGAGTRGTRWDVSKYLWMEAGRYLHFRDSTFVRGRIRDIMSVWPNGTPEYTSEMTRLLASFEGMSILCLRGLAVQTVSTPGFVGVIDLESASPDVSRNRLVEADFSDILQSAKDAIAPKVIENLNALQRDLLIGKEDFLAACVQFYGGSVLHRSSIPWISQLKIPGNVELVGTPQALRVFAESDSLFISFNSGPWTAMKKWVSSPKMSSREAAFLLSGEGQATPSYRSSSDGEEIGALEKLWPSCLQSPLFGELITLIAEAWQVSPNDLIQDGWSHETSVVYGRLRRPNTAA